MPGAVFDNIPALPFWTRVEWFVDSHQGFQCQTPEGLDFSCRNDITRRMGMETSCLNLHIAPAENAKDPYHDVKAHAVDAACAIAFSLQYLGLFVGDYEPCKPKVNSRG